MEIIATLVAIATCVILVASILSSMSIKYGWVAKVPETQSQGFLIIKKGGLIIEALHPNEVAKKLLPFGYIWVGLGGSFAQNTLPIETVLGPDYFDEIGTSDTAHKNQPGVPYDLTIKVTVSYTRKVLDALGFLRSSKTETEVNSIIRDRLKTLISDNAAIKSQEYWLDHKTELLNGNQVETDLNAYLEILYPGQFKVAGITISDIDSGTSVEELEEEQRKSLIADARAQVRAKDAEALANEKTIIAKADAEAIRLKGNAEAQRAGKLARALPDGAAEILANEALPRTLTTLVQGGSKKARVVIPTKGGSTP